TGQGVLFTEEQRREILEVVLNVNGGRIPVMVQVGSLTTRQSRDLAIHAEKAGADAISSVGPIYFPGGVEMVPTHYRYIADAPGVPFFPYLLGSASIKGDSKYFSKT